MSAVDGSERVREMRREIVLRELNQGALAGMAQSQVSEHAADLIVTALDRYDAHALRVAVDRLVLVALKARTAIPDGEVRRGCVTVDGAATRDALRLAVVELIALSPYRST